MINVGIDFGSTYTTVSVYREENDILEAKALSEGGSPFIPSMVAIKNDKQIMIGKEAKSMTKMSVFNSKIKSYRAFKMLLVEDDMKEIKARGFDEVYTPAKVASLFLENILRKILERENEEMINRLVVGVPEVWSSEITTVDGRAKLRDICKEFPFVCKDESGEPKIQIVSEPAAASAFFAYNYRTETEKNFDGKLLLVDYGGGTLDITLTNVETRPDENGKQGMEINVLKRTGAGEVEEGKVGRAGIVYMESLMETAILKKMTNFKFERDASFYQAVDELESQLQECTSSIKIVFEEFGIDEDELEESIMEEEYIFTQIPYRGMPIPISYQLMVRVYNDIIRGTLDAQLDKVIEYMNENKINFMDRDADRFKIALVGGFGNYYLVQRQVSDRFKFNNMDKRREHIIRSQEDCEKAISFGAALLASEVLRIRKTAPFSIGVCAGNGNGISLTYGLQLNQDIEFDKVYYQRDINGDFVVLLSLSAEINRFIINTHDDKRSALIVYPKPEFQGRLRKITESNDRTIVVGFSMDASGVLSLHVSDYDIINNTVTGEDRKIELTSLRDLFDIHIVEKAYKDE